MQVRSDAFDGKMRASKTDKWHYALDCVVEQTQMGKPGLRPGAAPNSQRAPNVEPRP
jgi:hypothetical protein